MRELAREPLLWPRLTSAQSSESYAAWIHKCRLLMGDTVQKHIDEKLELFILKIEGVLIEVLTMCIPNKIQK